jgi:hypothetical protein
VSKQPEQFRLLREFARGYLHQDLIPEYGDVMSAARSYLSDLAASERRQLAAEAQAMLAATREWNTTELNQQLHRMGSAWTFVSIQEFEQVLRLFHPGD